MKSRNPDNEAPDDRSMSERLDDDGKQISPEPSVQSSTGEDSEVDNKKDASEITEDEAKEMAGSAPRLEQLVSDLRQFNVKSVDDIRRIEEIINKYELYRKYGE